VRESPHMRMGSGDDRGDRLPVTVLGRYHELLTGPSAFHPIHLLADRARWMVMARPHRHGSRPLSRFDCHNHKSIRDRERIRTSGNPSLAIAAYRSLLSEFGQHILGFQP
jgi:hypothetical protein